MPEFKNFNPFQSTAKHFWVTGHSETSALNDRKLTLNPTRSIVPQIFVTSIHKSQISLRFALQWAIFELQAILRQVHWMTPNWPWTLQGLRYPIYVTSVRESQILLHFTLRNPFLSYRPFWDKCTEWPQMTLNLTRSNVPHICITTIPGSQISLRFTVRPALFEIQTIVRQAHRTTPNRPSTLQCQSTLYMYNLNVPGSQIHSVLLYDEPFLSYRPFWDKCTEWPQTDLEPYKFKGTPYMLLVSASPKFYSISLYETHFWVIGHFETSAPNDPKWPWTLQGQMYPIYV